MVQASNKLFERGEAPDLRLLKMVWCRSVDKSCWTSRWGTKNLKLWAKPVICSCDASSSCRLVRRGDTEHVRHQIPGESTGANVGRTSDHFGLVHSEAREPNRQGGLVPHVVTQARNSHYLGHHTLKVLVELNEGLLEQVWRACAEQVVDLVVGQTTANKPNSTLSLWTSSSAFSFFSQTPW